MSPSAAPAPAVTCLGLKNGGALHCTQAVDPAGVAQEDWETQTSLGLKEGVALSLMEPVDPGAALADQQTDTSPGMNGSVTLGPMQPAQEADAGDAPSATHTKNVKMVIKCALKNAMALDNSQYAVFSEMVEGYVNLVSRMMRRASLVMLYHVTKLASEGGPVPNLFKEKDTFWKNWLKLDVGFFPEATSAIKGPPLDYDALVLQHFSDVKEHLGPVMGEGAGFVAAYPSYFDQVIAYAATTFETTVCNNAWVPLFPRLARLTKTMVRSNAFGELGGIRTYDIMKQIRAREPDYTGWPDAAKDYAAEVRRRLLFDPRVSKCMYDEYGKTLHFRDLLMFNYWMTTRLTELGAKRISLSPVVKVARVHVRLDTKVLLSIAKAACPTAPAVAAFVALDAVHKQRVDDDNPGAPAFHNPDNGAHSLLPSTARPIVGKRSPELTDAQWAKVKEDVKRDQEAHDATVRSIRATDVYKTRKAEYDAYIDAKVRAGSSLFAGLPKKRGWAFDGSVCTDGVSVSLQYSKDVVVEEGAGKVRKKPAKKVAEPSEEYEKNLSTLIVGKGEGSKHTIVAGIDPGRANLATIAYVLDERTGKHFSNAPKKKSWSISRGQYYAEAGIFKTNSAKAERTAHLKDAWADLGEEDDAGARGSLRTASPSEVVTYLERYAHIREAWWTSALKRRESRARFQQYIECIQAEGPGRLFRDGEASARGAVPWGEDQAGLRVGRGEDEADRQGRDQRPDDGDVQGLQASVQGRHERGRRKPDDEGGVGDRQAEGRGLQAARRATPVRRKGVDAHPGRAGARPVQQEQPDAEGARRPPGSRRAVQRRKAQGRQASSMRHPVRSEWCERGEGERGHRGGWEEEEE